MFSEITATVPGWNGSAALPGSVPAVTRYSLACGTGRGVGEGLGVGSGVGVGVGVEMGVGIGVGASVGEGLGVGVGAGVGDAVGDAAPKPPATLMPATATTTPDAISTAT
jgi:hypothetical protein